MSESMAARPQTAPVGGAPFEQQLYMRSPFGTVATTAIVFAFLFGSFLVISAFEHVTIIEHRARGIAVSQVAWSSLVLSLLCCAALGMQRYNRVREAGERLNYAKILTGGMASATDITGVTMREAAFGRATIMGIVIGLILSVAIRITEINEGHSAALGAMIWFVLATTLLSVLFSRGVEQTRAGNRGYAKVLDAELKIDLLRTDTLAVLGRSAARSALIWFVVSAVACLFFVGGDLNWLTIGLIMSCAVMGIAIFASIMSRIHRQILTAKAAELEHIRHQIEAMRASMHEDYHAATRLHGLLAYEKRIADAQEWPFDQSTLVRVGASALIVTVPWFGQAIAAYVVDHLSHIAG